MACEASSLLEALHFKGYATNLNLASFIQTMPISASGNPNEGFGGSYQTVIANVFQSIYPAPQYHQYFLGTGIDNSHVMTLDGFKDGYYHVADPAAGSYWVSANSFAYSYNLTRYAVVVA